MTGYINTKENCDHFKGRVWISKGNTPGKNICLDLGRPELHVIAFEPADMITEDNVREIIKARGFRVEDYL